MTFQPPCLLTADASFAARALFFTDGA